MPRLKGDIEYLPIRLNEETIDEFDGNPIGERKYGVDILTLCRVCGKHESNTNLIGIFSPCGHSIRKVFWFHCKYTRLNDAGDPSDTLDLRKGMKSYCPRNFSDEGKDFVCDQCGKKLGTKDSLTTHKRMHLKQRPFVCEKPELNQHRKRNTCSQAKAVK
ncbi:hypothetical protein B566_EDAN007587 [Ephemera danica]|nr:hypothetical protein B566_EDAN007587 [Ephemera danica]